MIARNVECWLNSRPQLKHPGLRARVADVAWSRDRTLGKAAVDAIDAYAECAERLMGGTAVTRFQRAGRSGLEQVQALQRALYVSYRSRKRSKPTPDRLLQLFEAGLELAWAENDVVTYLELAKLGLYFELSDTERLAKGAEALVVTASASASPFALRQLLELALSVYESLGRVADVDRCRRAVVEQILAMRGQAHGAAAKAHWTHIALMELRHVKGAEPRRRELRIELRDLQEDSLSEFGRVSVPIDVGDQRDATLRSFSTFDLPTALKELACLARSRPVEELRRDALKERTSSPLMGMMGTKYSDVDGKTAAHSPGAPAFDEPDEDWFKATINRAEQCRRQIIIAGRLEPARMAILAKHDVSERHLAPIISLSGFVRPEHQTLVGLGLLRWLQGDQRSAVHLLVPQLEACLRFVLRTAGHDPVVDFDDLTEEDVGLPALLGRFRPQLESVIHPDILFEIDLLFHHRPGTALRHSVAHGTLGASGCFTHDAVYACWLMYQLTCWPLLSRWDEVVAPLVQERL